MNEIEASIGLLQLKEIDPSIAKRKRIVQLFRAGLKGIQGVRLLEDMPETKSFFSFFTIFIDQEQYGKTRDKLYEKLTEHEIYTRRYFYPLIS